MEAQRKELEIKYQKDKSALDNYKRQIRIILERTGSSLAKAKESITQKPDDTPTVNVIWENRVADDKTKKDYELFGKVESNVVELLTALQGAWRGVFEDKTGAMAKERQKLEAERMTVLS